MKKACQQCAKSHIRCSGCGPCSNCEKRSVECLAVVPLVSSPTKRWRPCAADVLFLDLDTSDHQVTFASCLFQFSQKKTEASQHSSSLRIVLPTTTVEAPLGEALSPLAIVLPLAIPLAVPILLSASLYASTTQATEGAPMHCEAFCCQHIAHFICEPCMHRVCQMCNLRSMASVKPDCVCCGMEIEVIRIL